MKLSKILFVRYLLRQRLIALVVAFVVCTITTVTVILSARGQTGVFGIILLIIIIAIWFFPLYLMIISLMNYIEFKKESNKIEDEKELYARMTNQIVRELIVKNGVKISIFMDKKSDVEKFNEIINAEIKFQRKKIELLNSNSL